MSDPAETLLRPRPASLWVSTGLACLATAVYLATLQVGLYNDGVYFEEKLRTGALAHVHLLNLPLVAGLQWLLGGLVAIDAETAIKVTAALGGGVAVALTHRVALRLLAPRHAMAAALLLAGLPGFWFHSTATEIHSIHAACSMILFLGLVRAMDPETPLLGTLGLVFLGSILGPASHASGAAAGLAGAYAVLRSPRPLPVAAAGGLGFGVYIGLQKLLQHFYPGLDFGGGIESMLFPFKHPSRIAGLLSSELSELLLLAPPAATLLPAGLWGATRLRRPASWMVSWWILGYLLVTFAVYDRAMASYFIPVFPVLAITAVAACSRLSRSPRLWLVILSLGCLPWALLSFGDMVTLPAYAVCAALLVVVCRRTPSPFPSPTWILALAAALITVTVYVPRFDADPIRGRINTVAAYTGKAPLILAFIPDAVVSYTWAWHFPDSEHMADFVLNPYLLDAIDEALIESLRGQWLQRVRGHLAKGQSVYVVDFPELPAHTGQATRLRADLDVEFVVASPEGAPPHVYRLRSR